MSVEALLSRDAERQPRRNLVVVRAGPRSRHGPWSGPERNFDLLVCAYHPDAPIAGEDARIVIPGPKVAGLSELFRRHPQLLARYARIAMIDDDIESTPVDLSLCFTIGERHELEIWQPALTADSYFSYAVFLQNARFRLRYVNFVEMMCPFFTAASLQRALPLLGDGWETGIDTIWCRQFEQPLRRCAVVDAVCVLHARPVGLAKAENGFSESETYDPQVARFLADRNATFRGPVAYAGILADGTVVPTRWGVFQKSLHILARVGRSPMRRVLRTRLILAYLRHLLTRPLNNSKVY